mgnify:CR=1 FL=1
MEVKVAVEICEILFEGRSLRYLMLVTPVFRGTAPEPEPHGAYPPGPPTLLSQTLTHFSWYHRPRPPVDPVFFLFFLFVILFICVFFMCFQMCCILSTSRTCSCCRRARNAAQRGGKPKNALSSASASAVARRTHGCAAAVG